MFFGTFCFKNSSVFPSILWEKPKTTGGAASSPSRIPEGDCGRRAFGRVMSWCQRFCDGSWIVLALLSFLSWDGEWNIFGSLIMPSAYFTTLLQWDFAFAGSGLEPCHEEMQKQRSAECRKLAHRYRLLQAAKKTPRSDAGGKISMRFEQFLKLKGWRSFEEVLGRSERAMGFKESRLAFWGYQSHVDANAPNALI